jgi:putative ABC transport system permease protein
MPNLDDELQFHLDEQTRLNIERGMTPEEARRQAAASLGSVAAIRDDVRDAHPFAWLRDLLADWKYGIRNLRSRPLLAATAILSLAIGVAVNATVYSFAFATVLSEPTLRAPSRLFEFALTGSSHVSLPNLQNLDCAGFSGGVTGYCIREFISSRDGESRRVFAQVVTGRYFDVTGTPVAAGRGLLATDRNAVVISHGYWQSYFAGSSSALGSTLELNRDAYQIVGILPERFVSTLGMSLVTDVIVPVSDNVPFGNRDRNSREFTGMIRARDGQSPTQLREALQAAGVNLAKAYPDEGNNNNPGTVRVFQGFDALGRFQGRGFHAEQIFTIAISVLVTLVLLIACANVAGVLLANGLQRRQEIAIRLSIGARRSRIVRQLLAETTLISMSGLLLGWLSSRWLAVLSKQISRIPGAPDEVRLMSPQFEINWYTFAYLSAVLVITTLVCGLLPAWQASKVNFQTALNVETGGGRMRLRQVLVGAQICAAVVLLFLSALFLRSSHLAASMGAGFDAEHAVLARPYAPQGKESVDEVYARKAEDALRALPGVEAVGWTSLVPLSGEHYSNDLHPAQSPETQWPHRINTVSAGYFSALGIPLVTGRDFAETDAGSAIAPVIVNETFARTYFPERAPIGQSMIEGSGDDQRRLIVIGVARDSRYYRMGETPVPVLYRSMSHSLPVRRVASLVIRTRTPAAQMLQPVQRTLEAVDRRFAIKTDTVTSKIAQSLMPYRAAAAILTGLGGIGLLLAFGGLFGVISCLVSRRMHELGIRLALGATNANLCALVARDSARIIVIGSVCGVLLAVTAANALQEFLASGVAIHDSGSLIPVLLVVAAAGLAASIVPVFRVLRNDPMSSLRHE